MRLLVVGSGPVAHALTAAWRNAGHEVSTRKARQPISHAPSLAMDCVMVAVSDPAILPVAEGLSRAGWLAPTTVLLHASGALAPEVLFAPLERPQGGLGLLHPLVSLAQGQAEQLVGATFGIAGDERGKACAAELARSAGGLPIVLNAEGLARYHAACVLAANHALALVATGVELLVAEGIARKQAEASLASLLASAAHNLATLGLPAALTGPIARGDAQAVSRHLDALPPPAAALYRATAPYVLALAAEKGAATPTELDAIAEVLSAHSKPPAPTR